jgi:hypothetical protein
MTDDKELCERLNRKEPVFPVHSLTAALRESMKLVEWCADSDDAPLFIKFEARDWLAANNQLIVGE